MRLTRLAIMAAVVLAGCSAAKDTAAAQAAITGFHQALNAGRFGPIYAA